MGVDVRLDPFLKTFAPDPRAVVRSAPAEAVEKAWSDEARAAPALARATRAAGVGAHHSNLSTRGWRGSGDSMGTGDFVYEHPGHPGHRISVNSFNGEWTHHDTPSSESPSASGSGPKLLSNHLDEFHARRGAKAPAGQKVRAPRGEKTPTGGRSPNEIAPDSAGDFPGSRERGGRVYSPSKSEEASSQVEKAWSDEARAAAAEARRHGYKNLPANPQFNAAGQLAGWEDTKPGGPVTLVHPMGHTVTVHPNGESDHTQAANQGRDPSYEAQNNHSRTADELRSKLRSVHDTRKSEETFSPVSRQAPPGPKVAEFDEEDVVRPADPARMYGQLGDAALKPTTKSTGPQVV